ncbi:hypothetical protein HMPREF2564_11255 [Staphylococcus sp. HMSC068D03]|uniref:hypothetical protein n=1 Tax=Staphylococcus sp. HMSC068D03 TaxID=1715044 RepID=UPI0008A83157|nr:hypothetical protein [Staphylococcus sp. HMSC068D03]OHQ30231.1 hypothetical protein HMPREF2564_11255 [Staphylococcus sp. HMSC068D03]
MNAIPKIYDKENEQWIELMARPIAEEVVKIMKEDFMKNKGPIKLLELPYGTGEYGETFTYRLFYNSKLSQGAVDYNSVIIQQILKDMFNELDDKREFTYSEIMSNSDIKSFLDEIVTLNLCYEDEWTTKFFSSKDLGILDIINNNCTVSYIFNDNPIETNQYTNK